MAGEVARTGRMLILAELGWIVDAQATREIGADSVDSSGWRNRAPRGIMHLPCSGDRMVAELGSWRGRRLNPQELEVLRNFPCPACARGGLEGLAAGRIEGFCNRATHSFAVLPEEAGWVEDRPTSGTYRECYEDCLDNSVYRPLIRVAVEASARTFSNVI